VNPSTAFGMVLADEFARCGLREVVLAPGSRSTPLAMAFYELDRVGRVRLHVRIDERSASFTALGLAKASGRPVAVVCTSGTAAANFYPAVIEASESAVPLLVLTADRPPELRGTGASQTIDQDKLYGAAVRWYADAGVPERRAGAVGYWRSLACRAWVNAAGAAGTLPGPVHLNLPFRDPLVPDVVPDGAASAAPGAGPGGSRAPATGDAPDVSGSGASALAASPTAAFDAAGWPESLGGRPGGRPWTSFAAGAVAEPAELPWAERGVVVCGDGDYDAAALTELAERAGWPLLAEPSSGARRGRNALTGYQYLLASARFMAAHRPQIIVSAGRPGLTRPQSALLGLARGSGDGAGPDGAIRHVVIAQGPGLWADPQRAATEVAAAVRLSGVPAEVPGRWLDAWRHADAEATRAADAVADAWRPGAAARREAEHTREPEDGPPVPAAPQAGELGEPEIARELAAALPEGAMLWCGNSLSVRDIDLVLPARTDTRVIASRGASGIDGTASTAIGAALAHERDNLGTVAFALIGDLSLLHDAPGLAIGPAEPRPDLCLIVVDNDGGGIFAGLEPARFPGPSERVFATPHGVSFGHLAAAFGIGYEPAAQPGDIAKAVAATVPGSGLRIVVARTARLANADLRAEMRAAAVAAVDRLVT
jgi:2-succinyl-5-enolpyruvyl-6-hydroxy-3-cyclohexene-1-carboxylate synthase